MKLIRVLGHISIQKNISNTAALAFLNHSDYDTWVLSVTGSTKINYLEYANKNNHFLKFE